MPKNKNMIEFVNHIGKPDFHTIANYIFLTPKCSSPFFSKNTSNLSFLAQEVKMNFLKLFFTFNYRILF
jgi:hypothetical protein